MEILAMRPVCMQSGSELLTNLDNVHAAKALLNTYELQLTGRLDETGTAQELGARDTVELVSQRYRLNPADVRKDLKISAALGKYPAVVDALPDPTDPAHPAVLDPALAKVIVTTLEKAPATVPVDVLEVAEEQMINAARISNPRELTKFGLEVLARLDTDGAEPAEDEARAKESLRLRQVDGGVKFSGFVAGASGEQLLTQIHTGAKPHKTIDGQRDPRTLDERQVDAFKGILDAAAGNPDHPGVPHITVTIDFNDLKNAVLANTPEAFRRTDSEHDGSDATGEAGAVGEMVFGGNLSASAVRLLACDAAILPIVLGGDSQPLDVGTEQRFVNRYLRRALNKRDKGCVVCKAPPWMCHAHHVIYWADGGPTSLHNLVLLCAAHHRAVHAGQWAVSITGGEVHVTRPDWADPPPRTSPQALADLAAIINWATPGPSTGAEGLTPAHSDGTDGLATDPWSPRPADDGGAGGGFTPAGNDGGDGFRSARSAEVGRVDGLSPDRMGGAGGIGASSNPMYQQAARLPAASRLPSPELAAAREAFSAHLRAMVPGFTDPWATDATPAAEP
ncbi:DUF222 domain-containing protein [Kribbella sp. NPDC058245]|uniref:HNH endonuclease signature motif containing protein n=1 Tax=Kribbella sp. NPDC058245 TaxID=3346399 RepID=UPI0036E07B3B